jgi:uncharacterized protein YkwD
MFSRHALKALPALAAAALLAAAPAGAATTSKTPAKRAHIALLHRGKHHSKRAHITLLTRPRHARVNRHCAGAGTPATAAPKRAMRAAVVCLVNQQRARHHLPPLHASAALDRSAQHWTDSMVASDQFTHGSNFSARISAAGFHWSFAGENIASGFQTPREVVRGWMASTGHCQNILNPNFADVGTGVSPHGVSGVGPSTWTQDFGLWMGHGAPSHNGGPAAGCPYRI